jgi:hypothetical protein
MSFLQGLCGKKFGAYLALPLEKFVNAFGADVGRIGVVKLQLMKCLIVVFYLLVAQFAVHVFSS